MTFLIVGGGKMGMSHLALATQYVGKSNVALCDSKLSTRLLFHALGYRTFPSVEIAARRLGKLAGMLIATPTPSHAPLAHFAIARKVPFFVEKPLTLNVASSLELLTRAESARVPAQVGFVLRYVASFQRLRWLRKDGRLGRLSGYTASMRGNVVTKPPARDSWQGDFGRGGGCLNEYGPHIIDLCRFIFGEVETVEAAEIGHVHSLHADDQISVVWTHRDATFGRVEIDWCDSSKRKSVVEFRAQFEHAEVRADNSALEINWHANAPISSGDRALLAAPVQPPKVGFYLRGEEFSLELEDFLGACLGRRMSVNATPASDGTPRLADGYRVDRIIDEIARKAGLK
jgi:predicted dehydrogenase